MMSEPQLPPSFLLQAQCHNGNNNNNNIKADPCLELTMCQVQRHLSSQCFPKCGHPLLRELWVVWGWIFVSILACIRKTIAYQHHRYD